MTSAPDCGTLRPLNLRHPAPCRPSCVPINWKAFAGLPVSAAGAPAPVLPTIWDWGRPFKPLLCCCNAPRTAPALVVAPTSVIAIWIDEARRFAPTLNVTSYTGASATPRKAAGYPRSL